jgi:hypothetical protein
MSVFQQRVEVHNDAKRVCARKRFTIAPAAITSGHLPKFVAGLQMEG